eukprot:4590035-Pyramimonas_sp.AAC.1
MARGWPHAISRGQRAHWHRALLNGPSSNTYTLPPHMLHNIKAALRYRMVFWVEMNPRRSG